MSKMKSCFAPGCKTGYVSEVEKCKRLGIRRKSVFSAPKDPVLLKKWADAVCRGDKAFASEHYICEVHFREADIIRYHEIIMPDGSVYRTERKHVKLKNDAIPCIFPHLQNE